MKHVAITLACLGLLLPAAVRAQEDLTPDQVAAYVALVKADQARDRGAAEEALRGYRDALAKYQAIAQKDPRWHPELVQYRLAYCANELEALRRRAEGQPAPASAAETVKPAAPAPSAEAAEVAALRKRIADLEAAAAAAPREAKKWESANAALQNENDRLSSEVRRLRAAVEELQPLAAATQAVARLAAAQAGLTEERDRLSAEAVRLQQRIADLEKAVAAGAAAGQDSEAALKSATAENVELAARVAALSNRLAKAVASQEEKSADTEKELAAARAESERLQGAQKKAQDDADSWSKRHAALMSQKEALEQRTAELYQKTLELDRGAQACEKARQDLVKANGDLVAQLEQATNDLAAARSADSGQVKELQDRIAKLDEQAQALRDTIDLQEREMKRVREFKKEIAALKDEKNGLEKKLKQQQGEIDQLQDRGTIEQLTLQVNELRRELDATQERLEAAEKQARDLLKENTFLKRRS